MATDKKLIFGADVSGFEQGLGKVKRALKDLQQEGIKVSKAFGGFDMSKGFGSAMGTKYFLGLKKEMRELRGVSEDTSKALGRVFTNNLASMDRAFTDAKKNVDRLTEAFKEAESKLKNTFDTENIRKYSEEVGKLGEELKQAVSTQQSLYDARAQMQGGNGGRGGINPFRALGMMSAGFNTAGVVANAVQSYKTLEWGNQAAIASPLSRIIAERASGDFSTDYFMNKRQANGQSWAQHAWDQFGGRKASQTQLLAGVGGGIVDAGAGVLMLRGGGRGGGMGGGMGVPSDTTGGLAQMGGVNRVSGGVQSTIGNAASYMLGGPEGTEAGTTMQGIDYMKAANPMESAALQFIAQTAALRVQSAKALQGRHMEAWGKGIGYGMDMGEAMQFAQFGNEQSGRMDWVLGNRSTKMVGRGMSRSRAEKLAGDKYDNDITYADIMGRSPYAGMSKPDFQNAQVKAMQDAARKNGTWFGTGPNTPAAIETGMGNEYYDAESWRNEAEGKRAQKEEMIKGLTANKYKTTSTRGLFDISGDMQRRGWNKESAYTIFERMAEGTGDVGKGERELKEVMAYAMEKGFTQSKLHEKIADAVSASKVGAQGEMTSFASLAKMFYGGLDKDANARDIRQNQGGMKVMEGLTQNQTFNLQKTAIAAEALGGKGTGLQMMALSGASYHDLAGGSKTLETLLPGEEGKRVRDTVFREGLKKILSSIINFDDKSIGDLSKAYNDNGRDIFKTMAGHTGKGDKVKEQFAAALRSVYKNASYDDAIGFGNAIGAYEQSGANGEDVAKRFEQMMPKHGDGVAEATVQTTQHQLMELYKEEIKIRKQYLDSLKKSRESQEGMANINPGFEQFAEFMTQFVNIMNATKGKQVSVDWMMGQMSSSQPQSPRGGR